MNFVAQVEDHLRDLGAEARKAHPGVKEASERAIINLRSLQTQYVAAVRRSSGNAQKHPTTALFQSQDVLRPFLLAANYSNADYELLVIALDAMQLLLRGDAVCPEDGVHISRVLVIQAWGCSGTLGSLKTGTSGNGDAGSSGVPGSSMAAGMINGITGMVLGHQLGKNKNETTTSASQQRHQSSNRSVKEDQSVALKILQTISMLVDSKSINLTQDVMGSCLLACLILGAGEKISQQSHSSMITSASNAHPVKDKSGTVGGATAIVRRSALATLNQIVSDLFEKVDLVIADVRDDKSGISDILLLAERTISDLCVVIDGYSSKHLQIDDLCGPFVAAAKEGITASPIICLALLDMISKRQHIGSFQSTKSTVTIDDKSGDEVVSFSQRLMKLACEAVISILNNEHNRLYGPRISSNHVVDSPTENIDFCVFYFATTIGSNILRHILPSIQSHNNLNMNAMCVQMIKLLVSFVRGAIDAYQESSNFEDGYIFSQTERDAFQIEEPNTTGRGRAPSSGGTSSIRLAQESDESQTSRSIISSEQLWRSFLSLDVLNRLMSSSLKEIHMLDNLNGQTDNDDSSIIHLIAGAASDFATISTSNREGILHTVMSAHNDDITTFTSDIKTSSSSDIVSVEGYGNLNSAIALSDKVVDASGVGSELPACDAGETSWMAFKCIESTAKSLKRLSSEIATAENTPVQEILSASFVSTITLLQHYIKRMGGSHIIVSHTLTAYEELAYASMVMKDQPENLRRQAILTSLCKLCLPKWGKKRTNCQLKESNIDALWTMLWLMHSHFEKIVDEWDVIISTFDQLGSVSISSLKLSPAYTEKAGIISKCFSRLPKFTTCFSTDALFQFTASLVKLSDAVSFEPMAYSNANYLRRSSSESSYADSIDNETQQPSIGGKLMNFAGRAFGGGQQPTPNTSFRKLASTGTVQMSKSYAEDFRETTCLHLASMKSSTPSAVIRKLPLPLLLLVVVAEANMYRFSIIEEIVAIHFCDLVAKSPDEEVRAFAMEALIRFMPSSTSTSEIGMKFGTRPVMVPDGDSASDTPLGVSPIDSIAGYEINSEENTSMDVIPKNEWQVLRILCRTIQRNAQVDTAETGLKALHVVLEGSVHSLSAGVLVTIVRTLSLLSGFGNLGSNETTPINRAGKSWANVSAHSFQIFKLIFDEYLESLPGASELADSETRIAMIDCCVAFGRSHHDVNTALTATGMLWSLADRDSSSETLDIVLSNLALLSSDNRPELRNCSVNTLFSCVVGLGEQFTDDQWKKSLNDTIFGVMKEIDSGINGAEDSSLAEDTDKNRYKVAIHHTRNSASKQWAATQVLAVRGLERVLRQYFLRLLSTASNTIATNNGSAQPWFVDTWKHILSIALDCSKLVGGRETLDVRMVGVELIVLCAQLSCKAGIVAAGTTARVGTNMEVVGGALRSVRTPTQDKTTKIETAALGLPVDNALRNELFEAAFMTIDEYRQYLEEKESESSDDYPGVDSLLTQVLTKIMGELAKLYECCKQDEMSPGICTLQLDILIENDNGYESRFLYLLQVIAKNANEDSNSRYLNQVQRGVMSLLQTMASNSSLRAFKALASTSGDHMFVRSDGNKGESFELEAAKTVASAFESDNLSDEAKVTVMCSVLSHYLKIYGSNEDTTSSDSKEWKTSEARYDIVTKVIDSGCSAAANIDATIDDNVILDSIWERIVTVVSSLILPPAASRYDGYAHHSKAILDIVAIVLTHLPRRKYALAEPMLEEGANRAVKVAFECIEDINNPDAAEGAVHVFLACFMGLCQKMPTCSAVTSLTNHILGDAIDSSEDDGSVLFSKTQQSLAIAVCESLQTTTSQDLLVGVFPLLCRLTNVENDGLRRLAGKILGGVNLAQAISRERQRAEEADLRAQEIEEENSAMLEEIEYLQNENDELQRQLALFTTEADS